MIDEKERHHPCFWYEPCMCKCVTCPIVGLVGWCTEDGARTRIQELTQGSLQNIDVDEQPINNKLKVDYADKALIGVKSVNVNISDYIDSEKMKETIDKVINNLKQLRQVV